MTFTIKAQMKKRLTMKGKLSLEQVKSIIVNNIPHKFFNGASDELVHDFSGRKFFVSMKYPNCYYYLCGVYDRKSEGYNIVSQCEGSNPMIQKFQDNLLRDLLSLSKHFVLLEQ